MWPAEALAPLGGRELVEAEAAAGAATAFTGVTPAVVVVERPIVCSFWARNE